MQLEIKKEILSEEAQIIRLSGELDIYTAPGFKNQILASFSEGFRHLIINLDGLRFMDSRGLGTLIGISKNVKEQGGTMGLICTNQTIFRIFQRTGLVEVFRVFKTEEESLENLKITRVGG